MIQSFSYNGEEFTYEVDEATWVSLDVSPDGREIVFDLLGEIYVLPIDGGEARLLRGGLPWDHQPRYAPDGQHISFTSDAGGGDNVWVMDRDGSGWGPPSKWSTASSTSRMCCTRRSSLRSRLAGS